MLKRYDLHACLFTTPQAAHPALQVPCAASLWQRPVRHVQTPFVSRGAAVWGGLAAGLPTPGALAHC